MPFRSQAQRRYMYSRHPQIAKRWRRESGPQKGLRERSPTKRDRLVRSFLAKHR